MTIRCKWAATGLLLLGVGCASASHWGATSHHACNRPLTGAWGGMRTTLEFDRNCDERIDSDDIAWFETFEGAWASKARAHDVSDRLEDGLYTGPPADLASWWNQPVGTRSHSTERTRAAWIESRWLTGQAKVLAAYAVVPTEQPFSSAVKSIGWPGPHASVLNAPAVCELVDTLNLAPLLQAGLKPTAVLDLDSTVWRGNVMDGFLAALVEQAAIAKDAGPRLKAFFENKKIPIPEGVEGGVGLATFLLDRWVANEAHPKAIRLSAGEVFFEIVALLRDLPLDRVEEVARGVFGDGSTKYPAWWHFVFGDDACTMQSVVSQLQARGVDVYVLSATLDVLAREGARLLGLDGAAAMGSVLEVKEGYFTGRVSESTYAIKAPVTRQWLPLPPVLAFGDSPTSDFDMLVEAAAAGVMVNPRPSLVEKNRKQAAGRLTAAIFESVVSELKPIDVHDGPGS